LVYIGSKPLVVKDKLDAEIRRQLNHG